MRLYNKTNKEFRSVYTDKAGNKINHPPMRTMTYPKAVGQRMLRNYRTSFDRVDEGHEEPEVEVKEKDESTEMEFNQQDLEDDDSTVFDDEVDDED